MEMLLNLIRFMDILLKKRFGLFYNIPKLRERMTLLKRGILTLPNELEDLQLIMVLLDKN